jgi:hypothetical protein
VALDNLDASIPLAAGQIPQNVNAQQNAMLQMQMRMQQLRQLQQSENALRQAFAPGNVDPSGRPTQNAMGRLAQQDPQSFMQLQQQFGQIDQRKALTEATQGEVSQQHKKVAYGIGVAALDAYDDTLKNTNDPKLALQKMQEVRARGLADAVADNSLPKPIADRFPPADPAIYRAYRSSYEAMNTKPLTQAQKIEFGFKAADEERAQRGERRAQAQFARGDTEKPDNLEVTKPDGSKTVTTGVWDKDSKQWVTTDGTKTPIEGNVRKVGPEREGSPQNQAFKAFLAQHPNASPEEMQHFLSQGFRPRSGQSAAVMKFMEEHPEATSDDIAKFVAGVGAQVTATRQFMSGKQGDAIRSFSVADSHLNVMQEAADALNNYDMQTLNRLRNIVKTEFGYEGPIDFNFVRDIVGAEVSNAIIGGAGGVTDREELRKGFDKANSPEQLAGVARFARKLIGGQLDGYRRQFKNSTKGSDEDFDAMLSDAARQDLPTPGATPAGRSEPRGGASAPLPDKQGAAAQGGASVPAAADFQRLGAHELRDPATGKYYHVEAGKVVEGRYSGQ